MSEAASITVATAGPARFEMRPHNCFACGTLNKHGLRLALHVEHGRCWTELSLDRAFEGWEGIAHGGIISAILDEVMAWSLVGADNWGVTARMTVTFKRPVPIGEPIRATGTMTRVRRRVVETIAELTHAQTGELLATAEGVYMAAGPERKRELREKYGFRLVPEPSAADRDIPGSVDTGDEIGSGLGGRSGGPGPKRRGARADRSPARTGR